MRIRFVLASVFASVVALAASATTAAAEVRVHIDKSSQTMSVYVNGQLRDVWPVSTGRRGYGTPGGSYRPQRLAKRHFSSRYNGAPMHNAIFFNKGYAIHGTSDVGRLGRPASHGCVRLHPSHASELYSLVQSSGGRTRITIAQ